MTDEHFMVWMKTAGLPNFRKLWGKIEEDLQPQTYKVVIENNYNVAGFNGEKLFVVSTANSSGGRNETLGVIYIILGVLCFVFNVLLYCRVFEKFKRD